MRTQHTYPAGRLSKCGAVFEVPADLVVRALKAICALPAEAECEVSCGPGAGGPVVLEGARYPRRKAVAGRSLGEEV